MDWKTSGRREHFVWMVWASLNSLSIMTFSWPGMCQALMVTWFLEHQVEILNVRAHRGPYFTPTENRDDSDRASSESYLWNASLHGV